MNYGSDNWEHYLSRILAFGAFPLALVYVFFRDGLTQPYSLLFVGCVVVFFITEELVHYTKIENDVIIEKTSLLERTKRVPIPSIKTINDMPRGMYSLRRLRIGDGAKFTDVPITGWSDECIRKFLTELIRVNPSIELRDNLDQLLKSADNVRAKT
jgi:hypothetical protein